MILDNFALRPLDETVTTDFYELTAARHRKTTMVFTRSNSMS
ncbi:IstB domain protein ATP-binding protein (fragment) [Parafrankia sp. Ea1.12]